MNPALHGGSAATPNPASAYPAAPAIATGKPSAATVPMARWVLMLHHVRKGTPTAAAPPPKRLEQMPIIVPIIAIAFRPGSSRDALGRRLKTICVMISARND